MDAKRRAAQQLEVITKCFAGYAELQRFYQIGPENTWNFDETGVQNACPGHMWVWVPVELKK